MSKAKADTVTDAAPATDTRIVVPLDPELVQQIRLLCHEVDQSHQGQQDARGCRARLILAQLPG